MLKLCNLLLIKLDVSMLFKSYVELSHSKYIDSLSEAKKINIYVKAMLRF